MKARRLISLFALFAIAGGNYVYWKKYAAKSKEEAVHHRAGQAEAKVDTERMRLILARELVRQGWLMAQRDALGLPTRDAALREPPLADGQAMPDLDVELHFKNDALLRAVSAIATAPKWTAKIPFSENKDDYNAFAAASELRSRGVFVDALKLFAPKAASTQPTAEPPADLDAAERDLELMNFTSQFGAVRRAHRALREAGHLPRATGILVRGYANLSLLSQSLWCSTSQVMAARAILYGQQMVALAPPDDKAAQRDALWHRAYAFAMAGLQSGGADDLEAAGKLPGGARPDWVEWLDASVHFQTSRLADLTAAAPGEKAQLPAFLAYLSIEHVASASAMNQFGNAVLQAEPDNVRVIDAVSRMSGPSVNHSLTAMGLGATSYVASDRVPSLPGVPRAVAAAAVRVKGSQQFSAAACAALAQSLVDAGADDRGEPSWAVLGRLLQDANYRNVERRIFFETHMWSVDATASYAAFYPLIADHPYAPYVSLMTAAHAPYAERHELVKDLVIVDPQLKMDDMLHEIQEAGCECKDEPRRPWLMWAKGYADWTTPNAEEIYRQPHREFRDRAVEMLTQCCPKHPIVVADKIETDWHDGKAAAIACVDAGGSPLVAATLAKKYSAMKAWPKAEKYLRKYLEVGQDLWAYKLLADNYLAQNDEARWLSTMQEILKQPDTGLDHAQANVAIANHFMDEGENEKAEPFADAAAESYAGWAMEVAAKCQGKLGHWDVAEDWIKKEQERYGPNTLWLNWCKRTGHGDKDAAGRAAGS